MYNLSNTYSVNQFNSVCFRYKTKFSHCYQSLSSRVQNSQQHKTHITVIIFTLSKIIQYFNILQITSQSIYFGSLNAEIPHTLCQDYYPFLGTSLRGMS